MAGVSTPELAAAVSNAGALGSLGIGATDAAGAREMIARTRELTAGPFSVNVFCHASARRDSAREAAWLDHLAPLFAGAGAQLPAALTEVYRSFLEQEDTFRMLLAERPAAVSFHFGLPARDWIAALRDAGIVTMATATSPGEAALIEAAGVDVIVAQGIEAGGHRGQFDPDAPDDHLATAALVSQLLAQTRLPVVAAGGIMDGRGIRTALDRGASAAQLGTAFILCPESSASEAYRANLKGERAANTRLTRAISGRPARGMVNRLIEWGEREGSPPAPDYPVAYDAAKQLHAAAASRGDHEFAAHWAGQGAPLAREMPAGVLVEVLIGEMEQVPG